MILKNILLGLTAGAGLFLAAAENLHAQAQPRNEQERATVDREMRNRYGENYGYCYCESGEIKPVNPAMDPFFAITFGASYILMKKINRGGK